MTDKATTKDAIESVKDTLLDAKLMVKLIAHGGNYIALDCPSDAEVCDMGLSIEATSKAACEKLERVWDFLDNLE